MQLSDTAEGTTQIFRWPCEPINLLIGHCDSPTAEYQDGFISEVRKYLTSRLVAFNLEPRLPENFFISRLIRSFEVKVKIGQSVLSSNILINFYIKSLGTKWDFDAETFLYVFERCLRILVQTTLSCAKFILTILCEICSKLTKKKTERHR